MKDMNEAKQGTEAAKEGDLLHLMLQPAQNRPVAGQSELDVFTSPTEHRRSVARRKRPVKLCHIAYEAGTFNPFEAPFPMLYKVVRESLPERVNYALQELQYSGNEPSKCTRHIVYLMNCVNSIGKSGRVAFDDLLSLYEGLSWIAEQVLDLEEQLENKTNIAL
jgi:hypothetical protein